MLTLTYSPNGQILLLTESHSPQLRATVRDLLLSHVLSSLMVEMIVMLQLTKVFWVRLVS